jgi:hypothetical protein
VSACPWRDGAGTSQRLITGLIEHTSVKNSFDFSHLFLKSLASTLVVVVSSSPSSVMLSITTEAHEARARGASATFDQ